MTILGTRYQDTAMAHRGLVDNISGNIRLKKMLLARRADRIVPDRILSRIRSHRLDLRNNNIRWKNSIHKSYRQ